MTVYYNEIDPFAAQWLRNLIAEGLIAKGEVDERSIVDVRPTDLNGYSQCHFFAGIGVWSHALRSAGVPDTANVWTGSCPCQPFSQAGSGAGADDERHLWPAFFRLIKACRPEIVFGEQVSSGLVVGQSPGKDIGLQGLRNREILRGVSHLFGTEEISRYMQGLPERAGAKTAAFQSDPQRGAAQRVAQEQSRVRSREFGSLSGEGCEPGFRFGRGEHTAPDRHRALRIDGAAIRSGRPYEQPLAGPDRPDPWLREDQRASGPDNGQYHDEPMGAGEGDSGCRGDETESLYSRAERQFIEAISREIEGPSGSTWLDLVSSDMEGEGYAFGAVDTCAAGFGAPHIRQRLYWVANSDGGHAGAERQQRGGKHGQQSQNGGVGQLAHADCRGWVQNGHGIAESDPETDRRQAAIRACDSSEANGRLAPAGPTNGFWRDADWLLCRDDKWRAVEPESFPLAHGVANRVGKLRGYGNAIVAPQAQAFIEAVFGI